MYLCVFYLVQLSLAHWPAERLRTVQPSLALGLLEGIRTKLFHLIFRCPGFSGFLRVSPVRGSQEIESRSPGGFFSSYLLLFTAAAESAERRRGGEETLAKRKSGSPSAAQLLKVFCDQSQSPSLLLFSPRRSLRSCLMMRGVHWGRAPLFPRPSGGEDKSPPSFLPRLTSSSSSSPFAAL